MLGTECKSAKPGSRAGSKSGKDFQEKGTIKFFNLQRSEAKCNSPEKFVWQLVTVEKQEVEGGEA